MAIHKQCASCQAGFDVDDAELAFLEKISPRIGAELHYLPAPTHCPRCREQRRLAMRNERIYYRRRCALSAKEIVSIYSPDSPVVVYEHKAWYSDEWDGAAYGREFDFSRPFFEQFAELHRVVPLMSLDVKSGNENCDYTNLISESRNCYQVVACTLGEDCMYCAFIQRNRSAVDCFFVFDSELCYECIDCYRCYLLTHSQYCQNCSESGYLYNCRSCANCFGCVSLVNKQYHIFNQPVAPQQYPALVARCLSGGICSQEALAHILELRRTSPQRAYAGLQNENVTGDHISYCKNSFNCFDCTYLEDCRHCVWFHKSKDCADCYGWGLGGELGYENHLVGNTFQRVLFCDSCWEGVSNLMYCRLCVNRSNNLFGCVGLRGKEYCVLNKQYSKDEYVALVPRIIAHMRKTGEWGEFFPAYLSPFCYNESVAHEYYPLSRAEALSRNLSWQDNMPYTTGRETISWAQVPSDIASVPDTITRAVLRCGSCRRNYRTISQELLFYRKMNLALPRLCFHCRHLARRARRNDRILHVRSCAHCAEKMLTSFAPTQPELVYCEQCYRDAVQ
ncbi:MAG TPA: hypothetical protein PLP17_08780 [Oligoflexia bacterium]|nr:hypothetical protein [Oligoflexia bacterium]